MEKRDCTRCMWLDNYGCSKGLAKFSECEWFVDWEEYTEEQLKREEDAGRTSPASGGDVRTAQPQDDEDDED